MNLNIRGIAVDISDQVIAEMVRERLAGAALPHTVRISNIPRIGAAWPGQEGIYAGMARGLDDQPDYPLIVGPEAPQKRDWKGAHEFEAEHRDSGWRLWRPHESALCYANVPELFKKDWYWTSKQFEGNDGYAWGQDFCNGFQCNYLKGSKFFVRLARSVSIID